MKNDFKVKSSKMRVQEYLKELNEAKRRKEEYLALNPREATSEERYEMEMDAIKFVKSNISHNMYL